MSSSGWRRRRMSSGGGGQTATLQAKPASSAHVQFSRSLLLHLRVCRQDYHTVRRLLLLRATAACDGGRLLLGVAPSSLLVRAAAAADGVASLWLLVRM